MPGRPTPGALPVTTASDAPTAAGPASEFTPTRLMSSEPASSRERHDTDVQLSQLAALRALGPGAVLGGYLLAERIGKGGMGEVWKAVHQRLGRTVAIKLMLRHSREAWSRFEREARLASALDHPHIAKLYEFSLDPPFIAMQYVEGAALHKASGDRIRALRDAALAVHHAHQRGVLHRDLKPDNVLVDAEGQAFILDFGLARPVEDVGEHLTVSGEVVGTPAFMAPEQARGETRSMDARTDVYGLGATLYALLSGRAPFTGSSTWDILRLVVDEDPQPPGGDRDLETICLTAMAKDPARRYASAADFAAELTRYLERLPVLARRAGIGYRMRRSMQRRPAIWGLATALVVAVIAGSAFGVVKLLDAKANLQQAEANLALAHEADTKRLALAAERERELTLQGLVEASRRELRDLDDTLARQLDDPALAAAYARDDDLLGRLAVARAQQPAEGIISCLAGEAELLRNREAAAIADFDAAIAAADGPVSRKLGALELASQGRALARLRHDFFDQMGRLFVFGDQGGYVASDSDGKQVRADLDRAGMAGDAYERHALDLWVRYLRAARSPDAYRQYGDIQAEAKTLAAQGGRRTEALHLLVAVLTPFPRNLDQVVATYTAAIDRFHGLPQAWTLRAFEELSSGRAREARADLDQALRLNPDYALARLMRAQAIAATADPSLEEAKVGDAGSGVAQALRDLDEAIRLAPSEPMCWFTRAEALRHAGKTSEALVDYHAATARAEALAGAFRGSAELWTGLAEFHRQLGQAEPAIAAYRHASACGDDEARLAIARLLDQGGDAAGGENELSSLLSDGAPSAERAQASCTARTWRAGVRERAGDVAGALADFDWILANAPNYPPAISGRAEVLLHAGRIPEALAQFDGAVSAMRAWAAKAKVGGMDHARADGHVADALVARASARVEARMADLALADLDEAVGLDPRNVQALSIRSLLHLFCGRSQPAAADAAAASTILMEIGDAARAKVDFVDALDAYAKAVDLHADDRSSVALEQTRAQRDRAAAAASSPEPSR